MNLSDGKRQEEERKNRLDGNYRRDISPLNWQPLIIRWQTTAISISKQPQVARCPLWIPRTSTDANARRICINSKAKQFRRGQYRCEASGKFPIWSGGRRWRHPDSSEGAEESPGTVGSRVIATWWSFGQVPSRAGRKLRMHYRRQFGSSVCPAADFHPTFAEINRGSYYRR